MDIRRVALGLAFVVALLPLPSAGASGRPTQEGARLIGATPNERLLADWALERYRRAGLELPPVEIVFHRDPAACLDNSGLYRSGRLDVCAVDGMVAYSRKVLLHELAHAWIEADLTAGDRERFLELRGLPSWNSRAVPWGLRGCEQAAEIVTWGLGEGTIAPLLPTSVDTETLASLYEGLTGRAPITPAAGRPDAVNGVTP
jgi:hypothetical protein